MKNTTHNMTLKQPYFDYIDQGLKTIELRLYDGKRSLIRPGDHIVFQNGDKFLEVNVKGLIRAESFDSLFDIIDVKKTGLDNRDNAIKIMEQFYDKEAQGKFGVVGIVVEKGVENA